MAKLKFQKLRNRGKIVLSSQIKAIRGDGGGSKGGLKSPPPPPIHRTWPTLIKTNRFGKGSSWNFCTFSPPKNLWPEGKPSESSGNAFWGNRKPQLGKPERDKRNFFRGKSILCLLEIFGKFFFFLPQSPRRTVELPHCIFLHYTTRLTFLGGEFGRSGGPKPREPLRLLRQQDYPQTYIIGFYYW